MGNIEVKNIIIKDLRVKVPRKFTFHMKIVQKETKDLLVHLFVEVDDEAGCNDLVDRWLADKPLCMPERRCDYLIDRKVNDAWRRGGLDSLVLEDS